MLKKTIIFFFIILSITCFGQFASLLESPMYVKGKKNFYRDTVSKIVLPIEHLDSLYKEKRNEPFQVLGSTISGDSAIWIVVFIKANNKLKERWMDQPFPLKDFKDLHGRSIKKEDIKGKYLVVNCWSITCGPCIKEIPQLNLLVDSLKDRGFNFLALTFDEPGQIDSFFASKKLKNFLDTNNPQFKFDIIPGQEILLNNILGVTNYPTTFIVDRNGKVKEIFEGVDLDANKEVKTYTQIMEAVKKLD